jgi:hypothetical protein
MSTWPFMRPEELAVELDQPKRERIAAQRQLRADQRAIVADREARGIQGNWSTYRDSRGWLGVDRYIQTVLAMKRRSRARPEHTPWGRLLADWAPERRCHHAFALDAAGQVVHHCDPAAVRWCLAGWLAHLCQKPDANRPHRVAQQSWVDRIDDKDARRLLNEVWAMVPERTRETVERIRRSRVRAADLKRLDQHPLGYWWFLAPHLAARWLRVPER